MKFTATADVNDIKSSFFFIHINYTFSRHNIFATKRDSTTDDPFFGIK